MHGNTCGGGSGEPGAQQAGSKRLLASGQGPKGAAVCVQLRHAHGRQAVAARQLQLQGLRTQQ